MCYVDDVVIATSTFEDNIKRLGEVFTCMKEAGLKCKPSKCEILRVSIKYLGHLCEAPVLGMLTEKGMSVLDTDALVVAICGILHQEQEWNGRTVLRPIAYGSKVLSDTEIKYGAPKADMLALTLIEKYRACLGSAPFELREDNHALAWLNTYSMDQSYIGR